MVSTSIIVLIAIAVYFKMQPNPADSATSASSDENLVKQTMETDLPVLAEVGGGGGDLFAELRTSGNVLRSGGFEEEKDAAAQKVIQALKAASKTQMSKGVLDARIKPKQLDSPEIKSDLQAIAKAIRIKIDAGIETGEFGGPRQAAFALVLVGRQIFENNTRLKSRQNGMAMMRSGLSSLARIERAAYDDGAIDEDELAARNEKIMAWNKAVKKVEDAWNTKLKSIETVAASKGLPNTADLAKIAKNDADPTFRIFAARRLGYALFERGDPGNQQAINQTLDELIAGSDKAVADAAKAGRSIKDSKEYYELRK